MATALDYRPPSAESQYDPQTVAMMKQLGIWHPALKLSPGTERRPNPAYVRENELMQHVMNTRSHQQGINENIAARKESRGDYAQQRADAASLLEQGRNDRAGEMRTLREQAEKDRVNQGLIQAAHEELDPARNKAIMSEYYKRLGVAVPGVTDTKSVAGEYGPSGPKVATPQGATNTTASVPYNLPERFGATHGTTLHDALRTAPSGYGFNVNTGEYIRNDVPGKINGSFVPGSDHVAVNPETGARIGTPSPFVGPTNPAPREEAGPTPVDIYGIGTNQTTPSAGLGPPTANWNIGQGFTPQGQAQNQQIHDFLSTYLNLPKLPQQQNTSTTVYRPPSFGQ